MPVTNEDLFKVTLASVGSVLHTRVYKHSQLCGENTRPHGCLPYLPPHTALSPSPSHSPLCTPLSDSDTETSEPPMQPHHFDRRPGNEGCFSLSSKYPGLPSTSMVPLGRPSRRHQTNLPTHTHTQVTRTRPYALGLSILQQSLAHHPCEQDRKDTDWTQQDWSMFPVRSGAEQAGPWNRGVPLPGAEHCC